MWFDFLKSDKKDLPHLCSPNSGKTQSQTFVRVKATFPEQRQTELHDIQFRFVIKRRFSASGVAFSADGLGAKPDRLAWPRR